MIIICDDDPIFGEKLKKLLSKKSEERIFYFSSCKEVIKFLEESKKEEEFPKIIFMDLMMPELDGFQCMQYITKNFPPFPVVGMTSGSENNPGVNSRYTAELFRACVRAVFIKSHKTKELELYLDAINTIWISNPVQPLFERYQSGSNNYVNRREHTKEPCGIL